MTLMDTLGAAAESPWAQAAQRGYETYFGVTQQDAETAQAEATAQAAIVVAENQARSMRFLAGAGVAVALAALLVSVMRK